MAQVLTPVLRVLSSTIVRKVRELPVRGEVLCAVGGLVSGGDVVAKAGLPGELHILRLAEKLGIEPFEVLRGLRVKVGDQVQVGTLLCEHVGFFGLFKSRFISPVSGTVEMLVERSGHLGIRAPARPLELQAYISGRVVAVEEGKSVTIETRAAFVQGIFGVGGERRGVLQVLPVTPETQLDELHLPQEMAGKVLVGGTKPALSAIKKAAQAGAVGMVVGALDDAALAGYLGYNIGVALTGDEKIPLTLIATEGFGDIPMGDRILEVLKPLDGMEVSLNGATQVRAGAIRPEIIVCHVGRSLEIESTAPVVGRGLEVGSKVRIIRVPYFGLRAEVVELPPDPCRLETGSYARVLRARLDDGRTVTVPRANVELI